jgi:hypothetical protein
LSPKTSVYSTRAWQNLRVLVLIFAARSSFQCQADEVPGSNKGEIKTMRVIVFVKATDESEKGYSPEPWTTETMEAMGRHNEETP